MLNERQIRFTREYVVDFNATQAYIRAGYSEENAGQASHVLLKNIEVQKAIDERKEEIAAREECSKDWVLRQWMQIAGADPNDLTRVIIKPCPDCWIDPNVIDIHTAMGFEIKRDPHPQCQTCGGDGHETVKLADTTRLKGPARRLFAGAKMTRNGLEIKMRDQDAALANIAAYLGMPLKRSEVSGPGGGPVPIANLTAEDLSDDALAAIATNREAPNQ